MTEAENLQARIEATAEMLRQIAVERGEAITPDGRVSERVAAELVGYEPRSLQNLRYLDAGPAYYRRPFAGSNVSYRLIDISSWIENSRESGL